MTISEARSLAKSSRCMEPRSDTRNVKTMKCFHPPFIMSSDPAPYSRVHPLNHHQVVIPLGGARGVMWGPAFINAPQDGIRYYEPALVECALDVVGAILYPGLWDCSGEGDRLLDSSRVICIQYPVCSKFFHT